MMFHGHADSAWSLDPLARALAASHRVFSFDLRGHGRSDWGAYTLAHFVGDMRGVVESLDLVDPIVVGHSLGGQAASQFAGTFPEIPRALVLIEALGPPPNRRERDEPGAYQRSYFRHVAELVRQPPRSRTMETLDHAVARFLNAHPLLDAERAAFLVDKATIEGPDGSRQWRFDPASRDWLAGHDHDRAEQRWQGVTCPTLVVLGADSWERFWRPTMIMSADLDGPLRGAELDRRLGLFANAASLEYVEIEGAGHMVHYDRPTELNDVVTDFLARLAAAVGSPA
jgi:pimeloyl-ACP methyl ester carboxylesterase